MSKGVKLFIKAGPLKADVLPDEPCTEPLLVGPELFTRSAPYMGGQISCPHCEVGWGSYDEDRTTCWSCGLAADTVFPDLMHFQTLGLGISHEPELVRR